MQRGDQAPAPRPDTARLDREISRLYTRYAAVQFREGSTERAADLASAALLFDAVNPDALYLVGSHALQTGQFSAARERLSRALVQERWQFFTPLEAREKLAEALFALGRTAEAYHLLSPYRSSGAKNSPRFFLLYSRLLEEMDKREELLRTLAEAIDRFPQHDGLQTMRIRADAEYGGEVLSRILDGDPARRYGKAVYAALIRSRSGEERTKVLERYEERWSPDRFSRLYRLIAAEEYEAEAVESFFGSVDALEGEEIEALLSAFRKRGAEETFRSGFAAFTGEIGYDEDGNGRVERREHYLGGEPDRLHVYGREPNGYAYLLEYNGGTPDRLTVREAGEQPAAVEVDYGSYPRVEEVRWQEGEELLSIRLVPYEYRYPIFTGEERGPLMERLAGELEPPKSERLLPHASRIERREGRELTARFIRAEEAARMGMQESSYRSVAEYAGTTLVRREKQYRGEEAARIVEYYREGRLQTLVYDGNGNGTPELIEHHGREILQMWDFDEDGSIDYETRMHTDR
jgi:tetratricopeptide (TPR) repeat protein